MDKTVGVGSVNVMYHWLLEQGASAAELESATGIHSSTIDNVEGRIPFSQLVAFWDWAIQFTNDPELAIRIGSKVDPARLSIVAQAFFSNDKLFQGFELYERFYRLINDSGNVSLTHEADNAVLEFTTLSDAYYCIPEMERTLVATVARGRYFLGEHISPKEVWFQHDEPDYVSAYQNFFKAPVKFNQSRTLILFDPAYLDLKMKSSNPFLFQALNHYAENLLKKLYPKSEPEKSQIATKVENFIKTHLAAGELDLETAAAELHMSRNSLYRKLKKEELSFKALVDDIRHEKALHYLTETNLPFSEVAFFLGFSELSAFSRAFKRWTGKSPQAYRQSID